jgi:hypothetical protein
VKKQKENIMKRQEEEQERRPEVDEGRLSPPISRRTFVTKSVLAAMGVMSLGLVDEASVSAAAFGADSPLVTANQLQVCAIQNLIDMQEDIIWHTIRLADGSWAPEFGNVNDQESNGGNLGFTAVDCAGINSNLHVCAVAKSGKLWHTIRFANGSWQRRFRNVNAQESNGGNLTFVDVSCGGTPTKNLHVCAVQRSASSAFGQIWHTIRLANGSWMPQFGNVNDQESNGNDLRFYTVDCTTVGEDLHVCAVDTSGIIWHTIRFADGSWVPQFGNVNKESNGGNLRFFNVSCAAIGGDLHICAVTTSEPHGQIWHTIRFANGSWQTQFTNVNKESNGGTLPFFDVDCANVENKLHVVGAAGKLWHTIRSAEHNWSPIGDVNAQESNGNTLRFFNTVGISGTA